MKGQIIQHFFNKKYFYSFLQRCNLPFAGLTQGFLTSWPFVKTTPVTPFGDQCQNRGVLMRNNAITTPQPSKGHHHQSRAGNNLAATDYYVSYQPQAILLIHIKQIVDQICSFFIMFNTGRIRTHWLNKFQISSTGWDILSLPTVLLHQKGAFTVLCQFSGMH